MIQMMCRSRAPRQHAEPRRTGRDQPEPARVTVDVAAWLARTRSWPLTGGNPHR